MPESWDPNVYRQRAEAWRMRAAQPEDEAQQDSCFRIAEGYEGLAALIEAEAQELRRMQRGGGAFDYIPELDDGPRPGREA